MKCPECNRDLKLEDYDALLKEGLRATTAQVKALEERADAEVVAEADDPEKWDPPIQVPRVPR